jgi:hypothetical protein
MQRYILSLKWTDVSEMRTASTFRAMMAMISLMVEAVSASETRLYGAISKRLLIFIFAAVRT